MEEQVTIERLREVSRQLARELGIVGDRHPAVPCTVTEGHVLIELDAAERLTVSELADRLALDKSTTSRAVSTLAARRRVSQTVDTEDRRRKPFRLTKTGQRLVDRIHEHADERVCEALRLLAPDDAKAILDASRRFARALNNARAMRNVVIREVEPHDNAQLMTLLSETRTEHRQIIGDEALALEDIERDMHALYAGSGRSYRVIVDGERVLGGAGFSRLDGGDRDVCELQRMYFVPEIRGRGLGYRLLALCLADAAAAGYRACYAETMADMNRANRLYEKAGFERLAEPLGATGHTFTDAWFWKDLRLR